MLWSYLFIGTYVIIKFYYKIKMDCSYILWFYFRIDCFIYYELIVYFKYQLILHCVICDHKLKVTTSNYNSWVHVRDIENWFKAPLENLNWLLCSNKIVDNMISNNLNQWFAQLIFQVLNRKKL